jgi:hypothetical protein
MALKVDEATNFVFVQLIEQEPDICNKRHPDYARQDKIDLAWERFSHDIKESKSRLSSFVGTSHNRTDKQTPSFDRSHTDGQTPCFDPNGRAYSLVNRRDAT